MIFKTPSCLCLLLLLNIVFAHEITTTILRVDRRDNCSSHFIERNFSILQNGSLFIPNAGSVHHRYAIIEDTAHICDDVTDDVVPAASDDRTYYQHSDEFMRCSHILIDPDEYKLLQNGTVFIEIYARTYEPRDYLIQEHGVYVCLPQYEEMQKTMDNTTHLHVNKFSKSFAYVSQVGICLSIISLVGHLAVFCSVSSVRNLPGFCLASLSLSLLSAYACFLGAGLVRSPDDCASIGVCIYYFFTAAFFWMNAIAFDIWRSFRVVTKELRISSNRVSWRRFTAYSTYSWLAPAILVTSVKMADSSDLLPADLKPSFGAPICWFGQRKPLLLFFATPLCIVLLLNAAFFLDVTYVISRAALKTGQSLHEATLRKRFFMFLKLALIMGLTWIVGIIAGSVDNQVLWYLFVVLNTLQGLFIFVVFSLSSKVKNMFSKTFRNRTFSSGISTSIRTISQAV